MFCRKCGKQIQDNNRICPYCGMPVQGTLYGYETGVDRDGNTPSFYEEDSSENGRGKQRGKGCLMGALIGLFVLLLVIAAGFGWFLITSRQREDQGQEQHLREEEENREDRDREDRDREDRDGEDRDGEDQNEEGQDENNGNGEGSNRENGVGEGEAGREAAGENSGSVLVAGALSDSDLARTIAKYNSGADNRVSIDVFAENYVPGTRNVNYAWDRNLFYTLEDVNPDSASDGMINGYNIARKILRNAVSGNKMEYEIYTNPSSGRVNKIVSIEYFADHLEITDYYYDDYGKVSFIFVRNDINYIPSYAVPGKDGQRFYFNSDCMTKWRIVSAGVQSNYVIGQASANEGYNAAGSVSLYQSLASDAQANYDAMEKRMINAAYNTYHIVLAAEGISEITGYVYEEGGTPVSGANVILMDGGTGEGLYQAQTDSGGMYQIAVPSQERVYQIVIQMEGCVAVMVYNAAVGGNTLSDYQNTVYLVQNGNTLIPIQIQLYDALNYAISGNGMERLSNAAVYIRDGVNHREGGVVAQGTADINGQITLSLLPGMYTAEVVKNGYDSTYYSFAVKTGVDLIQISASPKLAEGEVRIVLTWGATPADLDSHLFTPYDSAFGDTTYHIWYGNKQDAMGNNLDVDDTDSYGPETMTIPVLRNGLYKYYIADFTNCSHSNSSSYEMSASGAMVNVYTSNGLTASFTVPSNRPGVIWEVFEIRNGAIVPIQRYYSNIEDKTWWHSDK